MQPDTKQAEAMISAFVSVGARYFDVTRKNAQDEKTNFEFRRSEDELRRTMSQRLHEATTQHETIIIRPRSTGAHIAQLDDLDAAKLQRVEPHAFLTFQTSPGNFQAWVAVSDPPASENALKDLDTRFRAGAGADKSASGATRIAGSLNFKPKYAPAFPLIELRTVKPGHTVSVDELSRAGLIAPRTFELEPPPQPPARRVSRGRSTRRTIWPSYDISLRQAPPSASREGKTRDSIADFIWCRTASQWGHETDAIAAELLKVSAKARENGQAYAKATAEKAADSQEASPYRNNTPPGPR